MRTANTVTESVTPSSVILDIEEYYNEAVQTWGQENLPPLDSIYVVLEPHLVAALGASRPKRFPGRRKVVVNSYYLILISKPWFGALFKTVKKETFFAQMRDTVLHELAHVSQMFLCPQALVMHDETWQQFCLQAGVRAKANAWEKDSDKVRPGDVSWGVVKAQDPRLDSSGSLKVSQALGSVSGGSYCCPGCGRHLAAHGAKFGQLGSFGDLALHCRKCANTTHFIEMDLKLSRQHSAV